MKKILITGANGFLGSNLTKYLSANTEYRVYAMVRTGGTVNFLHEFRQDPERGDNLFELVEADLSDDLSVENAIRGMDVIIHLAGMVTDWGKREDYHDLNVEGTGRVLRGAEKAGVERVIYLSSLTVHSMNGHNYSDETVPRDMKASHYGVTKKMGEDLVCKWADNQSSGAKRRAAIVRPGFVIYGPYDKNTFINVLDAVKKGGFGFINGGRRLMSYVYVENLCYGIYQLIKAEEINGAYNILDGNMSWKEWISHWAGALGVKTPRLSVPYWFMLPVTAVLEGVYRLFRIRTSPILTFYRIKIMHRDLAFSNRKMEKNIGYNAPVSFKDSIKSTIDFYCRIKK